MLNLNLPIKTQQYKLVALDIGGVLATINKAPLKIFAHIFDEDFTKMQRGDINPHDFFTKKSLILHLDSFHLQNIFSSMIVATAQEILPQINVDYFFMSNINEIHFQTFLRQINATQFALENSFLSFRMGVLKPQKLFFKKVLDHFCVLPTDILFIDDKLENLREAQACGFTTKQCSDPTHLPNILKQHHLMNPSFRRH